MDSIASGDFGLERLYFNLPESDTKATEFAEFEDQLLLI
jgi:hypothetical protein